MPSHRWAAIAFAACLLALLWVAAAVAQGAPAKWHWQRVVTTGGCAFYRWVPQSIGDPYAFHSYEWSGQCTGQKLLTGRGTLHVRVKADKATIDQTHRRVDLIWTGAFNDGVLQGGIQKCSEEYKQNGVASGCIMQTFDRGCNAHARKAGCVPGTAPSSKPSSGGWKTAQAPAVKDKIAAAASGDSTKGCLTLIDEPGSFGGFKNSCKYAIELAFCVAEIRKIPGGYWSDAFACEEGKFGATKVPAQGRSGDHTKGGRVFYVACHSPKWPVQIRYEKGRGLLGNCK